MSQNTARVTDGPQTSSLSDTDPPGTIVRIDPGTADSEETEQKIWMPLLDNLSESLVRTNK
jgi:hypothetical protein